MVVGSNMEVEALLKSFYGDDHDKGPVNIFCLLPTGITICLLVDRLSSLQKIKQSLWHEASNYPFFSHLQHSSKYVFVQINNCAEQEEIHNEDRTISSLRPFGSVLKIIEKQTENTARLLNAQIGNLIGKSVHEFEDMKDEEIIDFRQKSAARCKEHAEQKLSEEDINRQIMYSFPPDICQDAGLRERLLTHLKNADKILILVHDINNNTKMRYGFEQSIDSYPEDIVALALQKRNQSRRVDFSQDYVLKVCGREEYLVSDRSRPLYHYSYIYKSVMKGQHPELVVAEKGKIVAARPASLRKPSIVAAFPPVAPERPRPKPARSLHARLWDIKDFYTIRVREASKVNCADNSVVQLKAALYHGVETLCDIQESREVVVTNSTAVFDQELSFDIAVCDLPRMARLCISLYTLGPLRTKTKKLAKSGSKVLTIPRSQTSGELKNHTLTGSQKANGVQEVIPLVWVNVCVFDFKGRITVGDHILHMWPHDDALNSDGLINHLGTVVSNPSHETSTSLSVLFSDFEHPNRPILFPSHDLVLQLAAQVVGNGVENVLYNKKFNEAEEEESQKVLLGLMEKSSPLLPFHEQDKEKIWGMRLIIQCHFPNYLPKLLSCVQWHSRTAVAQMQALLTAWPAIETDTALELLDCMYPDQRVRSFAVKALQENLLDTDLCRYILQLVQALKFESYLDCELVFLLLKKAIFNRHIGHYLYWLLRSEMHVPSVSVRFGLILEAYLRGAGDHLNILTRQLDTLGKLRSINVLVKEPQYAQKEMKEQCKHDMRMLLKDFTETVSNISSPLNPSWSLATLKPEECKFMDSKMKPLWLVWNNADPFGKDIKIIFKNGDDLRQDMLTLQVLQIMDNIWSSEGLDLRMIPYECLATGCDVGVLEVVQDAETISNIQKLDSSLKLTSAFNRESLYNWLKTKNPNADDLKQAIEAFTLSCAGYCVATYVLGIGDRHSDNIMLKSNGQMFHIDFGHFLGNFKSKFGIKRERVPFVLTHDFVYIITKGDGSNEKGQQVNAFEGFKALCEKAFLILRKKGNLLISLFMMMLSTGIPELRSVNDIKYLQETLVLDRSDEQAKHHFQEKLNEAVKNSWKTSVNWAIHNAAKNNN